MFDKKVKDLMIPVKLYPTVPETANLTEAIIALHKMRENSVKSHPYRAVLAVDKKGCVVGKIGYHGFLKAFEPKYDDLFDVDKLSRAGTSAYFLDSLMSQFNLWDAKSIDLCAMGKRIKVKDVMQPINERLEEDESAAAGVHKLIMWDRLSAPVSRKDEIVGILRLADLFEELENDIAEHCKI